MSDAAPSRNEYDIIFAGGMLLNAWIVRLYLAHYDIQGGTTACVIAGRLAQADPLLKILVLESGSHTKDKTDHIQPGRFLTHIAPGSNTTTLHISKPGEAIGGRNAYVHSGRCVGGGSAVNALMYNRASASDYDDWEIEHNNPGWGSEEIIPLLQKVYPIQLSLDGSTLISLVRQKLIRSTLIFLLTDTQALSKSLLEVTLIFLLNNSWRLVPRWRRIDHTTRSITACVPIP